MMRPNMGKQMMKPGKPRGVKLPEVAEDAMQMPNFKARALRPGGMKKGGMVSPCKKGR